MRWSGMRMRAAKRELVERPEATVGIFALLLDFPWPMLQASSFADVRSSPHATATATATMACSAAWPVNRCSGALLRGST